MTATLTGRIRITASFLIALLLAAAHTAFAQAQEAPEAGSYGVRFFCSPSQLEQLSPNMFHYLQRLGIPARLVKETVDKPRGAMTYSLLGSGTTVSTLLLAQRTELAIKDEVLLMPVKNNKMRKLRTVSQKEILLALLHPGRLTEFRGRACDVQALADHVGIRQNTVAWAEVLEWGWPEGGPAKWNARYWANGTPRLHTPLHKALNDMFFEQGKYDIGCYAATKVVFAQGALDYFRRVKRDAGKARVVERRLLADGEPLVDLEPGRMWSFEVDFDPLELERPGKVLRMVGDVAPGNFVPGDWVYFLNTDVRTNQKTGYEGSNAIYLGGNRFDDYYNDNDHHYSYQEKLSEVYQWRHDVFSRHRDAEKIQPLAAQDYERLNAAPENGGLLMGFRVVPYFFGYEDLLPLPVPRND
ncbi:hypothetical protein SAMN05720382_101608 [Polaromonas sp. JS666]|nr:hypothetical protein SAMN05720382_101608 [Polaromonas sp. JS666]